MLHAHVITPGSIGLNEQQFGEHGRMVHYVHTPHLTDLRYTTQEAFGEELERVLGRERGREVVIERDRRLSEGRYPGYGSKQAQWERIERFQRAALVKQLVEMEGKSKQAEKEEKKRKRRKELQLYLRFSQVNGRMRRAQQNKVREKTRQQQTLAREEKHKTQLTALREKTRQAMAQATFSPDNEPFSGLSAQGRRALSRLEGQSLRFDDPGLRPAKTMSPKRDLEIER